MNMDLQLTIQIIEQLVIDKLLINKSQDDTHHSFPEPKVTSSDCLWATDQNLLRGSSPLWSARCLMTAVWGDCPLCWAR